MQIKKTFYYPVDIFNRVIIDKPFRRERDIAWKYRNTGFIGLKGQHLIEHDCYRDLKEETING